MKKQILKMLSIILCATTLMPTHSVVWAAGDDDKNDSKTPTSVNESKTSLEEGQSANLRETEDVKKDNKNLTNVKANEEDRMLIIWGNQRVLAKKPRIRKTNRTQRARRRQEARKTSKRYRFLSQVYNANVTSEMIKKHYTVSTPFSDVDCECKKQTNGIDIFVKKDDYGLDYSNLCNNIKFLSKEKQIKLAEIILNYLETPPTSKGRLEVKESDFFQLELENFLNEKDKQEIIDHIVAAHFNQDGFRNNEILNNGERLRNANDCAAILSGILFVAESAENRMGDGGKSARSILRAIICGDKTFEEVFAGVDGKDPWYPPAKKGGAEIARKRSCGESVSDYDRECFEQIEDHKYMSDSSVEESSDEE